MPYYLVNYSGNSRLRSSHLDYMSYILDTSITSPQKRHARGSAKFYKSFYYRAAQLWNNLPLDIREISAHVEFKLAARDYLWGQIECTNLE